MKFSVRDLLLVTMIVALALGWAMDHYRPGNFRLQLQLENTAMRHALQGQGWKVEREGWRVRIYRESNPEKNDYETWIDVADSPNPSKK